MKLHYMKAYSGNEDDITVTYHRDGAVPFKEIQNIKTLGVVLNIVCTVVSLVLLAFVFIRKGNFHEIMSNPWFFVGCISSMFILFPHEILHAICFKKDVYLYTNFKNGMLFVLGPEDLSKARFIFMSLLPNIIFGFIPYIVFMFWPDMVFLGAFGGLSIAMGCGDYYNVINAIFQMPKGARTYLYKTHSYWYIPREDSISE